MRTRIWQGAVTLAALWWSLEAGAVGVPGQGTWQTTLQGRDLDGNMSTFEAYYDTVLNITWLANANYAQTSGHDADGDMNWSNATAWASNLNPYGSGITGWRLPTVTDTAAPGCDHSYSAAGQDCGYNVDTSTGEMAHMFYTTLGNLAYYSPVGSPNQGGWGLSNTGPFSNLQPSGYWSGTALSPYIAWRFYFDEGAQGHSANTRELHAWAVHSGDVGAAAVPLPAAAWLLLSGLAGLGFVARRKTAA